jgi:hypothetical protein
VENQTKATEELIYGIKKIIRDGKIIGTQITCLNGHRVGFIEKFTKYYPPKNVKIKEMEEYTIYRIFE